MGHFKPGVYVVDVETGKSGQVIEYKQGICCLVSFANEFEFMAGQKSYMFKNAWLLRNQLLPVDEWNMRIKKRREKEAKRASKQRGLGTDALEPVREHKGTGTDSRSVP